MFSNKSMASKFALTALAASAIIVSDVNAEGSVKQEPVVLGESVVAEKNIANPRDPYEGFNRSVHGFNMTIDRWFLKPVATGYKEITPVFVQSRVSNFFTNLKGINVVLNDFLQGKVEQGASDIGRFTTNSTLGVLGLFDVATDMGIESHNEDFGQTLAVWGVGEGSYLVLPIMGPTTTRDGAASVFDRAANPGTYVPGVGIVEGINDRANAQGALNFIDEAALDPYVFMRESYLQYRSNLVNDGKLNPKNSDLDLDAALDEIESDKGGAVKTESKTVSPVDSSATSGADSSSSYVNEEKQFQKLSENVDKLVAQKTRKKK